MEKEMYGLIGALGGAAIGGFISIITTLLNQVYQRNLEQRKQEVVCTPFDRTGSWLR
jgi:hypothetical protein